MDPVTQGVVGALAATPTAKRDDLRQAALAGAVGGMAADLDVLIRSSVDTLLYIEYHRQFTHSFVFAPLGSLLAALFLWPFLRRRQLFAQVYLWCLMGYLVHPILDAATSYGTQLWWPFSDLRVAWNWISVIDPLYSLPALSMLLGAVWLRQRRFAWLGLVWMAAYLAFGALQNHRAEQILQDWALERGLAIERLVAKPAFANLVLWRGLIDDGDRFHLVAIRSLPGVDPVLYSGGSVARFAPWQPPSAGRRALDLHRFDHFSSGWLFRYPSLDQPPRQFVGDFRYALDPADQRPLWGILVNPNDPSERAEYTTSRSMAVEDRTRFFMRLRGEPAEAIE